MQSQRQSFSGTKVPISDVISPNKLATDTETSSLHFTKTKSEPDSIQDESESMALNKEFSLSLTRKDSMIEQTTLFRGL